MLTINQGCRIAVLLMKNRHDQVREAGADLASQLYAMDASHECEASRSILRRKGISFASEWTETLVRRFL